MRQLEQSKIGKRGTITLPARFRRRFGLAVGTPVIAEARQEGILIRRAKNNELEIYSRERQAEFLRSNAVDAEDYQRACKEVRRLGLDPARIRHLKPQGA